MDSISSVNQANTRQALIRLRDVQKTYTSSAGSFTALKGINLDVYPGEFLAITGKSGAGKTTLVNMITGTDSLTEGEVWVGDVSVHRMNGRRLTIWRGLNMGIVFQSFHLIPNLSLIDNVMLPMDFCGRYRRRVAKSGPWNYSRRWICLSMSVNIPRKSLADSSSVWPSPVRWRTIRPSW